MTHLAKNDIFSFKCNFLAKNKCTAHFFFFFDYFSLSITHLEDAISGSSCCFWSILSFYTLVCVVGVSNSSYYNDVLRTKKCTIVNTHNFIIASTKHTIRAPISDNQIEFQCIHQSDGWAHCLQYLMNNNM